MPETSGDQPESRVVHLQMSGTSGWPTAEFNLSVIPEDGIEVEVSDNLECLRLRAGIVRLPQTLYLVVQGERLEITQDALPEESS